MHLDLKKNLIGKINKKKQKRKILFSIFRNMAILNEQSKMSIGVTLCVPDNANGVVR